MRSNVDDVEMGFQPKSRERNRKDKGTFKSNSSDNGLFSFPFSLVESKAEDG